MIAQFISYWTTYVYVKREYIILKDIQWEVARKLLNLEKWDGCSIFFT